MYQTHCDAETLNTFPCSVADTISYSLPNFESIVGKYPITDLRMHSIGNSHLTLVCSVTNVKPYIKSDDRSNVLAVSSLDFLSICARFYDVNPYLWRTHIVTALGH